MRTSTDADRLAPWGVERSLWFARWVAAVFAFGQGSLFEPLPHSRPYITTATYILGGVLIVANVLLAPALRRRRVTRWQAASMFAVDLGAVCTLVWLYLDNPDATQWVLFMIVQLEAAYRWDMRGAVGTALFSSAFYAAVRYAAAQQFGFEFTLVSVTYVLGLTLIQGLVVGGMASKLRAERDSSFQLHDAALSLNAGLETKTILSSLAEEASRILKAEFAVVWVASDDGFVPAGSARLPKGPEGELRLPASDPVFGESTVAVAHRTKVPIRAPEPGTDRAHPPALEATVLPRVWKAVCSVPILHEERSLGVLSCYVDSYTIGPEETGRLQALAALAAVAMTNAEAFEREISALENLRTLDRLKDDFLSTVSHELRTPLTVVEGFAATLRERWDDLPEEKRRDLVDRINSQARELHERIRDLLDFSRLRAAAFTVRPQLEDVSSFVHETVSRLEPTLARHPAAVEAAPVLEAWFDPSALSQVLENLLVNAGRYSPAGSPVSVRVEERTQGWVDIRVQDAGIGIPTDEHEHIFERFYRGRQDAVRKIRGTGIGLAVVKELTEAMGGQVWVQSELGQGSTFTVRLPRHAPSSED